jgi:hypothetical protein
MMLGRACQPEHGACVALAVHPIGGLFSAIVHQAKITHYPDF